MKARALAVAAVVAALAGSADSATVVVQQVPASITVDPASLDLQVGDSPLLVAAVRDADGSLIPDGPVVWSSSHPSIVAILQTGRAFALGSGDATVTATSGPATGQARVAVASSATSDRFTTVARPYTADSPWNTPVATDAPVDPRSDAMVATILESNTGMLRSDPTRYTYPVYFVDASTPRTTLTCSGRISINNPDGTRSSVRSKRLPDVPIPSNAIPSAGSDAQIIVIDTQTGDEYDVWQFAPPNNCRNATKYVHGVHRDALEAEYVSRGAGVPYLAGLIRPWEIAQGRIEHALAFGYTLSRSGRCVWPASKTDGDDDLADAIPQGARLRLDPSVDVEAIVGLDETGRIIARALQEYGMFLIDNSGANKIYAEDEHTAGWGSTLVTSTVDAIPVERLQVLRLPEAYRSDPYQPDHGNCVR